MKYRKRLLIIIFTLLLTIIGGTFAWYTYSSKESALVLTIGNINDTRITVNPYQVRETVVPVNVYTSGVVSQVEVINNSSTSVAISFYYKINELSEDLINNGLKYTITSSDSLDGNYTEVLTGDFTGYENGMVTIYEEKLSKVKITYYKIYIWLDSNYGDQSNLQNLSLDIELNATIYHEAAKPELDDGMIPVTIENDGTVITIDEDNPEWYNYSKQEWANMILVTESSRSSYVGTEDKEVNQDDILAYYVWIPRYKYKIWTTEVSSTGQEQTIDIIFEDKYAPVVEGTSVGEYRTHPAFIWDGDTVSGIWVGKFETSADTSSMCYTSPSEDNCNNAEQSPRIVPNVSSLRHQSISNRFQTALKFAGGTLSGSDITFSGSSTYGLTSGIDSHMMKNSEWGAVAYLSHSLYGINQEIYINNSSGYYTGRSGGNVGGSTKTVAAQFSGETSTDSYNTFGYYTWLGQSLDVNGNVGDYEIDKTLGTNASTTGNLTGVYDMSGGSWEYVMGNYADTIGSSGFSVMPDNKYYDKYTTTSSITACNDGVCFGHALSETINWYGDYSDFVASGWPWFIRGSGCSDGAGAGVFFFNSYLGNNYFSFRSVLIKDPYKEEILNGADPDLDKGMIPVTIADDGIVTTSSIYDSNWYNYENKNWANAILVTDESRDKYFENEGVTVSEEDILAYYVWIPRYSYAFPKADGNPETISIVFESADTEKSNGTATGTSYYTHPAFTFDGKELNGIWVGKFETTSDKSSTCYSTPSLDNCNNTTQNPTVLPNESSLRYQYIGNQFATSQNISKNGNIYGISNTLTDAHMMKNSEWGAVAYLSHSEYGVKGEVRLNNYWNETYNKHTLTGCGAATATTTTSVTTCSITYGSGVSEYPQSTTGNITGVFDMSGGAHEYVMGNYGNTTNSTYIPTLPDTKYYDLYLSAQFTGTITTNTELCTLATCGGHALNETVGWYDDFATFVVAEGPWFIRGGNANVAYYAGAFFFHQIGGIGDDAYSWRSVLVVGICE